SYGSPQASAHNTGARQRPAQRQAHVRMRMTYDPPIAAPGCRLQATCSLQLEACSLSFYTTVYKSRRIASEDVKLACSVDTRVEVLAPGDDLVVAQHKDDCILDG